MRMSPGDVPEASIQMGGTSSRRSGEMEKCAISGERTTRNPAAMAMNSSLFDARPQFDTKFYDRILAQRFSAAHPFSRPQRKMKRVAPIQTDTDADKVLAIIDLQAFDGSWDPEETKLLTLLGFKFPKAPKGVKGEVWATILVIVFLETKIAGEEGMWGLVVEKARGYVQSAVHDRIEELEKKAGEVVGKN
jgi:hypothetical protein